MASQQLMARILEVEALIDLLYILRAVPPKVPDGYKVALIKAYYEDDEYPSDVHAGTWTVVPDDFPEEIHVSCRSGNNVVVRVQETRKKRWHICSWGESPEEAIHAHTQHENTWM